MRCNLSLPLLSIKYGYTALMDAARIGHHGCLSILLAHGAEVDKARGVSVRGVGSIAYLWDVACIGAAAEGMRCNHSCHRCQ